MIADKQESDFRSGRKRTYPGVSYLIKIGVLLLVIRRGFGGLPIARGFFGLDTSFLAMGWLLSFLEDHENVSQRETKGGPAGV
jgi:hypothetical protein